ncbi:hypothetical protein [Kitasatospora sp. NPDC005856]|uniref:hypothetical protein n=1 Tax=Kitasatospora sp. NPDC005856 TaxID=3154566 RepID=UPI0033EB2DE4
MTMAQAIELNGRLKLKEEETGAPFQLLETAREQLNMCMDALRDVGSFGGSRTAVAQIHFDAAFILYLRAANVEETAPMIPAILGAVQENLPPDDLRRKAVEEIAEAGVGSPLSGSERETVLDALNAAHQAAINKSLRIRSFVRIVSTVGFLLALAAMSVATLTLFRPHAVPLCFVPPASGTQFLTVCPLGAVLGGTPSSPDLAATDPADYLVVEIIGLVSAGLAAASSLRQMRGTTTPYNVSLALAWLKLPTGALTAPLGLLFMRGGFVPGLSALDSSAQIIAWAIVFGYSQQLLTRLVDNQAKSILQDPQTSQKPEIASGP